MPGEFNVSGSACICEKFFSKIKIVKSEFGHQFCHRKFGKLLLLNTFLDVENSETETLP
jgi:hypothetical protein